jgi:hypothetical protein
VRVQSLDITPCTTRAEEWSDVCVQGGKAAAQTILDMRAAGDYSKLSTRIYEQRWMKAFGHDFAFVRPLVKLTMF